jgi:hypothetical protein
MWWPRLIDTRNQTRISRALNPGYELQTPSQSFRNTTEANHPVMIAIQAVASP